MLAKLQEMEVRIAHFLPGLKTKISILLGALATFVAAVDPAVIAPVVPPSWQPFLPLVFFGAAYYAHRLTSVRTGA